MIDSRNLLENADYAEGESQSVTDFLEIDCNKCGNKIKFKLAIGDIKNVEEYIEQLKKTIQTQQEEIEALKTRKERQLVRFSKYKENIENKHEEIYEDLVKEIEKKDKIIDLMTQQIKFYDERLLINNYQSEYEIKKTFINKVEKER